MASLPAATNEEDRVEQARWLVLQGSTWPKRLDSSTAMQNFVTFEHLHIVYDDTHSGKSCAAFECSGCSDFGLGSVRTMTGGCRPSERTHELFGFVHRWCRQGVDKPSLTLPDSAPMEGE